MATAIKTIKNHLTDDTIYPITTANAVFLANSTVDTVEGVLGNTDISSLGDGTITGAIDALNDSKVSKSGDTMTGNLDFIKNNPAIAFSDNILNSTVAPASNKYNTIIGMRDTNGVQYATIQGTHFADGKLGVTIQAQRRIGSNVDLTYHNIRLLIAEDGTRTVSISEADPWLEALGLNNILGGTTGSFAVRFKTGKITVPAGTSTSPSTVSISTSDILPSGYKAWSASVCLNDYQLPFHRASDNNYTAVSHLSDSTITIENTSGAWNNFTYYATVFYRKAP